MYLLLCILNFYSSWCKRLPKPLSLTRRFDPSLTEGAVVEHLQGMEWAFRASAICWTVCSSAPTTEPAFLISLSNLSWSAVQTPSPPHATAKNRALATTEW